MRRQPVTDKAHALDADPEPAPLSEPEPVKPLEQRVIEHRARKRARRALYNADGDRSTFERDFAEVRMVRRIGGVVIFALIILLAISQHHPSG